MFFLLKKLILYVFKKSYYLIRCLPQICYYNYLASKIFKAVQNHNLVQLANKRSKKRTRFCFHITNLAENN